MKYKIILCCLVNVCMYVSCKVEHQNKSSGDECSQGNDTLGRCEEIRSCLGDGGIIKRNNTVYLCSPQGGQLIACCRKPLLVAKELCRAWKSYWEQQGHGGKCANNRPLIVGGEEATLGEFPHVVSLGYEKPDGTMKWSCGGTLVSPHYVLTAAHCVNNLNLKDKYHIAVGEHDLTQQSNEVVKALKGELPRGLYKSEDVVKSFNGDALIEQRRRVANIIQYPEYVYRYHDIALLLLEEPITITKRAIPACLPLSNTLDLLNKQLIAMGWGRLFSGSFQASHNKLLKVGLPVVDSISCYLQFKDPSSVTRGITSDQVCAGAEGKDTCQGDSGGPLIMEQDGVSSCEQTVVGVTSFGEGCGKIGVYTRVSAYLDWITGYIAPQFVY